MTEDVSTTKRKKFTRTQRLAIFERHKGVCVLCSNKITDRNWIVEHMRALVVGGTNDPDNLAPVHKGCADAKTYGKDGDLSRGAKAKKQKKAALIPRSQAPKLKGAPFRKVEPKKPLGKYRIDKGALPALPPKWSQP